jgi:hypothetical protein
MESRKKLLKKIYFYSMKKTGILLFLMVGFVACTPKVEPSAIAKINGYWEIEKVELPDGQHKDYKVNDTYDYFEINGDKGFRKKVMPQFDGTYQTNNLSEKVQVLTQNKTIFLEYTTPYSKWKEELLELTDSVMVLRNAQKNEYHYKKTAALNLTGNGKKTP